MSLSLWVLLQTFSSTFHPHVKCLKGERKKKLNKSRAVVAYCRWELNFIFSNNENVLQITIEVRMEVLYVLGFQILSHVWWTVSLSRIRSTK